MELNRVLLDTSAYSKWKSGQPEAAAVIQEAGEIVMSPIVLGELLVGFRRGKHRRKNEDELDQFLSSPRVGLTVIDSGTSERYAVILDGLRAAGSPIPANDIWIAASAMQHGLVVVTSDAHFRKVPQIVAEILGSRP